MIPARRDLLCLSLLGPATAHATIPDLIGLGGRWSGAGGGGVAVIDDGNAAYLNPAGLSRVRRPTAALGYIAGWPRLDQPPPLWWDTNLDGVTDERDPPLQLDTNPAPIGGFMVHAARNVGGKFGLGLTAYIPTDNLIRFSTFEPSLPIYIMWDNRPQRFVTAAALGGEIAPGLSLGIGADLLAKARLTVASTLSARVGAPEQTGEPLEEVFTEAVVDVHEIDMAMVPALAPIVGLQLDVGRLVPALDGLVLGASYHGEVGLPLDVELFLQTNVSLADLGDLDPYTTALVARGQFALFDHFVPRRLQLGVAYRRADALTLYADGRWTDWRSMVLNVAQVSEASLVGPLIDLEGVITDGNAYSYSVRATWGLRMGADLQLPPIDVGGKLRYLRLSFRGGFGFDPTPLVEQGPESALLDTDRSMYTLGMGMEHWDALDLIDGAVRWDLFVQWHTLHRTSLARNATEPTPGYPVSSGLIPAGGSIPVFGGQWSFDY
ncbi:MAG TPA: hypothetical protein ENK18_19415 [Deltaproteobacteria bacterium]|nr:hypothetical protein [Deltaproteobacteria bacterium]